MVILSGALAITIGSACAAAYGADVYETHADLYSLTSRSQALSLTGLQTRLRNTSALSVGEKLSMKSEIATLMASLRVAHEGSSAEVEELRQPYERLLSRIRARLGRDPQLATDIAVSRDAIWDVLSDHTKFASRG
jgi:hypothetical protein